MLSRLARSACGALVLLVASFSSVAAAPSDLNGDGKSDLIWYNAAAGATSVWVMNGGVLASQGVILIDPNWKIAFTGDFNGDGRADILWYNASAGATSIWLMNGTTLLSQSLILNDPSWKVTFVADFNGDGKSDLIWHNESTGQTVAWLMNGLVQSASALLVADTQWEVTGTPDLNGDGKADLLWRNRVAGYTSVWLMNGLTPTASATLLTDRNWEVVKTADLNGDGKTDLLWYNESAGQTVAWLMNGTAPTLSTVLLNDPNWKIQTTLDLNGDGKADLLWHNNATGQTSAWLMNGTAQLSTQLLLTDFSWNVVATPDLNGDGRSDLLWFNANAGSTSTWLMNGLAVTGGAVLLTDPDWRQATQPEQAGYWVRALSYFDSQNYSLRYYASSGVPSAAGDYAFYDQRIALSAGVPVLSTLLYDTAVFATPTGWKAFNAAVTNINPAANPAHTLYGYGYEYDSTRAEVDVSGQTIASVVTRAQDTSGTSSSTLLGLNPGALTGTMPRGARVRTTINVGTATPIGYRASDGTVPNGVASLSGLPPAYPVPTSVVPTGANTVSMGNLHGNVACGQTNCPQERMRVAFGAGNSVTYYLCDLNTSTNQSSNCGAIGTGSYALGTAVDGTTPIMTFANLPAQADVKADVRVFVARNGFVYYGWKEKLSTTTQTRLNDVAFGALAVQLGITPPVLTTVGLSHVGNWTVTYSGGDSGSCTGVVIDAAGGLLGSCVSTVAGGTFTIGGSVTPTGATSFTTSNGSFGIAAFGGSVRQTTASGTWSVSGGGSGTWSATKQP